MNILQNKLDFLLDKYSVNAGAKLNGKTVLLSDGREIPILSHRAERRFIELKNIVNNGTLQGISVMRVMRIVPKNADIFEALYREFDLCEYILQKKIIAVTAMQNDNTVNVIVTAEGDIVCTIEIAATLKENDVPKDKHEIISQRGIACDIAVDTQLKQDSVYVFADETRKFTDVDFELYGLSMEDIAVIRAAFKVLKENRCDEMIKADERLKMLIEKAKRSVKSGERQEI